MFPSGRHQGLLRDGSTITAYGSVFVSIDGLPEIFRTDPSYQCKLQLVRYVPKRRKRDGNSGTYVIMPRGFYHPSTFGAGSQPSGSGGGDINGTPVPRVTDWPILGFGVGQGVTLLVGDIFAPYFDRTNITDRLNNSLQTLVYHTGSGNSKRVADTGVHSYGKNPFRGVFRFRFAILDVANNRWIYSGLSDTVYIRPAKWPTFPRSPAYTYNYLDQITTPSTSNPASLLELVAAVGGVTSQRP